MARAKPGLFSAVSGLVSGIEFAMGKHGTVLKKQKPCRRLDRPLQIDARTSFFRRVSDWHNMTAEAKTEWNAYAASHPVVNRLGQSKYISGYNWFFKLRDTDDGILLPYDTAKPPVFGPPVVYEGGPYTFPITWPAESTDDWKIHIWFGELIRVSGEVWPLLWKKAGIFKKSDIANLNYDTLAAKGITFTGLNWYEIRGYVEGPRYFPSTFALATFYITLPVYWAWYLPMDDEASNPTVHDSWGHYNQTFEGDNPNTEDHSVNGVHGKALHFDGAKDKIVLSFDSYAGYLDEYQDFTICLFWKPDTPVPATFDYFLSNYSYPNAHIHFGIKNSKSHIGFGTKWGAGTHFDSVEWDEEDVSIWHHYAMVRSGKNVRCFRDGVIGKNVTQDWWQGKFFLIGTDLSIGCRAGLYDFAKGAADEVYLFDYALSDEEVAELAVQ